MFLCPKLSAFAAKALNLGQKLFLSVKTFKLKNQLKRNRNTIRNLVRIKLLTIQPGQVKKLNQSEFIIENFINQINCNVRPRFSDHMRSIVLGGEKRDQQNNEMTRLALS